MHESINIVATPIAQLGFAGFSIVLLVFLAWLVKRLLAVIEKNTEVIKESVSAIHSLHEEVGEIKGTVGEVRDKLLSRPCIARYE
jgi:F0F1-type ATP synthase membrane subunit b/b'